jgi:Flp pilus assembly protein protease CpaA
MSFDFLFWVFFIGIFIAVLQDLKRRETDNWLNLLLLVFGWGYLIFSSIFGQSYTLIFLGIFCFIFMFLLANILYYSRFFAGGDAKLLFAMFALFVGASFYTSLLNMSSFVLLLFGIGGIYGLLFSVALFFMNFKKVKTEFKGNFKNIYLRYLFFAGIVLFGLSFIELFFLIPALFVMAGVVLYVFAKSLEKVSMTKFVKASDLREGDWLAENIRVEGRLIKSNWEGLTQTEVNILKRNLKRNIKIKEGIPFTPAFLITFVIWYFFKEVIISFISNFFNLVFLA